MGKNLTEFGPFIGKHTGCMLKIFMERTRTAISADTIV